MVPSKQNLLELKNSAKSEVQVDQAVWLANSYADLLDKLAQTNNPEAQKLHENIIKMVEDYDAASKQSQDEANTKLQTRLNAIEMDVCSLLSRNAKKMFTEFKRQGQMIGTTSKDGKVMSEYANVLQQMHKLFNNLVAAAEQNDNSAREQAYKELDELMLEMQEFNDQDN